MYEPARHFGDKRDTPVGPVLTPPTLKALRDASQGGPNGWARLASGLGFKGLGGAARLGDRALSGETRTGVARS